MKKIKFIVCFLSVFFLFKCNVKAEELTCLYKGGWYNSATKLVQTDEGEHFVYTNAKNNKPLIDDADWKKQDNLINFEGTDSYDKNSGLLMACPLYTRNGFNNNDFTFYFYDEKTWHLDYELYDCDDAVSDDSNITQSFTEDEDYSTEIADTNWIGICSYEDVTLYFNRKKLILDNKSSLIYRSETGFSLNELLEYYDLGNSCPILYQEINNPSVDISIGNYNVTYYLYDKNNRLYQETFIKEESSINDDNKIEVPTINIEDCLDLFSPEFIKKLNFVFGYIIRCNISINYKNGAK